MVYAHQIFCTEADERTCRFEREGGREGEALIWGHVIGKDLRSTKAFWKALN